MTTANFPKALWPGVYTWFNEGYDEGTDEYKQIFTIRTSGKKFEQTVGQVGFGLFAVKPEGEGFDYDDARQGFVNQYNHLVYSSGFVVTQEAMEDNQYSLDVFKPRSRELGFAAKTTREIIGANVLNNGFNTAYTMGSASDGKPLFSASHLTGSSAASQSNLSTAGDLSELVLEGMVINITLMADPRGKRINVMPDKLIIPAGLMMDAERITGSPMQNDTANNAINVLKAKGWLPGGIVVNHFLTDTDAFFIATSVNKQGKGLVWFDRKALTFKQDNEFDTDNLKAKAAFRCSVGWDDAVHAIVGNQGV